MPYLNSVILQGNLVRDPESHSLSSGTVVASFTLAVNRNYPKRDGTWQSDVSYFDCETWASEAQRCCEELQKGTHVKVIGRLQQDRWQDKEGHSHSKIKVVSEYFEKQQFQGNGPNQANSKELAAQKEALHKQQHPTEFSA